jgi:hypothetical protein
MVTQADRGESSVSAELRFSDPCERRTKPARTTTQAPHRIVLSILLFTFTLCLTSSCCTSLVQVRNENASAILATYRARPLAVINHGITDLSIHDCVRLGLENSLDLQTALWEEQVRG